MEAVLNNECFPLTTQADKRPAWHFLERYPELAFHFQNNKTLGNRLEAHYRQVLEFCEKYVAPQALDIDRRMHETPDYLPDELLKKACDYRLFSMAFPSLLGGAGEHLIASFITYEVVASHCVGIANLLGVNGLAIGCVLSTFDPRALAHIAELITTNERNGIPTFLSTCVTEPGAGSDAEDADEFADAKLYTSCKKVKGGYVLNGTKVFISNGRLASLHVVTAYDADGDHRPEDLRLLLVSADSKGVLVPRDEKKMGQKVCPASEVVFTDVFVPDRMVCRTHGSADHFAYAGIANVLGLTRAGVGGFATGVAENAWRTAQAYAARNDFLGQPMQQQQWVQVELAHLARRAQVARSTYLGALLSVCSQGLAKSLSLVPESPLFQWMLSLPTASSIRDSVFAAQGTNHLFKWAANRQTGRERDTVTAYADVAKVSCSELAMENCQAAISLMGKNGLRHDQGAEKLLRDVKLLQIYEGTNQVNMLDFIKRRLISHPAD